MSVNTHKHTRGGSASPDAQGACLSQIVNGGFAKKTTIEVREENGFAARFVLSASFFIASLLVEQSTV